MAAAGVLRYAALRDGVFGGGVGLRIADGIAQFAGAATAPAHRRHGIQAALLSARLVDASAAGCDVAVIVTQPGSKIPPPTIPPIPIATAPHSPIARRCPLHTDRHQRILHSRAPTDPNKRFQG